MNILIDATSIRKQKAGVGVYARNLIEELAAQKQDIRYYLLAQDDDRELDFSDRSNFRMLWVRSRLFRKLPLRFLLEQVMLPLILLRHRIDVIHSLHYSFPLIRFGSRQVVTLHDMTSLRMPEVHVPIKVLYFRLFIGAAVLLADAVIFVSKSSQQDCRLLVGEPRGLSRVIHLGKSPAFHPGIEESTLATVRGRYDLPREFMLYIGTIEPRKNLPVLVRSLARLSGKYPELHLVIAGMKGWNAEFERVQQAIEEAGLECKVRFTGFIDEADKPALIACAQVFVYPSKYEGFGLPVLESMACGTPAVTSNVSSLPEVAGVGAFLVSPDNEGQIAYAVDQILSVPAIREQMREAGLEQAARFSWEKTARDTAQVYLSVFKGER